MVTSHVQPAICLLVIDSSLCYAKMKQEFVTVECSAHLELKKKKKNLLELLKSQIIHTDCVSSHTGVCWGFFCIAMKRIMKVDLMICNKTEFPPLGFVHYHSDPSVCAPLFEVLSIAKERTFHFNRLLLGDQKIPLTPSLCINTLN